MSQQQSGPATYKHAEAIYKKVEKLPELLSLLDPPEKIEGGPIEQIQTLLETLVTGVHQLHLTVEDLHSKIDSMRLRKSSKP